jgi:hypothetical protein
VPGGLASTSMFDEREVKPPGISSCRQEESGAQQAQVKLPLERTHSRTTPTILHGSAEVQPVACRLKVPAFAPVYNTWEHKTQSPSPYTVASVRQAVELSYAQKRAQFLG